MTAQSQQKLSERKCAACSGQVEKLTAGEQLHLLDQLSEWSIENSHHLEKDYKFKNFKDALDWLNKIAEISEEENHHPDLYVGWGKVGIKIWTHKVDGLTTNDFILAAKIDQAENNKQ
ncbi:4a-hydroxytetrahydrobiopterin dehydratase [bacterium J17]|nr:4a-hydroxytetrahydrobiopterin dehydratase [bacterium J17]